MTAKKKNRKERLRRKVNIFLVFLVCSSLAWLVSRLSENYTQSTSFDLLFVNTPDSLRLIRASKNSLDVRLSASGFQFLGFNFKSKQITLDLGKMDQIHERFYIAQPEYRKQIQEQLTGTMTLLEADRDTLFFDFYRVFKKEVPIQSNVTINLGQNYLLEEGLTLSPVTVVLMGPKEEITAVNYVSTLNMELTNLSSDFETLVALSKPKGLENTTFSVNTVKLSGKVFRFSEKILEVPIRVINLPEGTAIRTFPNTAAVLCKARIDRLKNLNVTDFEVVGDYSSVNSGQKMLALKLLTVPKILHSAQLLENEVEFILKRE